MIKRYFFFIITLFCASILEAQDPSGFVTTRIDAIVATVDGEPITVLDVLLESGGDEQVVMMMYENNQEKNEQIIATRKRVLDEIINRKLIWKAYKKQNYPIPDELIESSLDKMASVMSNGSRVALERKLRRMGVSMIQIREKAKQRVACDLMIYEFCFRRVVSTPRNQLIFYNNNIDSFRTHNEYEIALMMLFDKPDSTIQIIDSALKQDSSLFSSLSIIYSDGPNAVKGGFLGTLTWEMLTPHLQELLKDSQQIKGVGVWGPFQFDDVIYFVHIISTRKGKIHSFNEVRGTIKEMIERPIKEKLLDDYISNLRNMAIIKDYTQVE